MIKNPEHTSLSQALVRQPYGEIPEHVDLRLWLALTLLPDANALACRRRVSSGRKRQNHAGELAATHVPRRIGPSARKS